MPHALCREHEMSVSPVLIHHGGPTPACLAFAPMEGSTQSSYRLGVDVGGTFTDLIVRDDATGAVLVGKELSSPAAPEEGVLRAVAGTLAAGELARADVFVHGTTVGLNALIERRGATVGL